MDKLRPPADSGGDYAAFGLLIRSDIALPELSPAAFDDGRAPDVVIRLGEVPERPDPAGPYLQLAGDQVVLEFPAARYGVCGGRDIVIAPTPGASRRDVRLYLLGSVIGALCQQRGDFLLHANAIDFAGQAVAFVGSSGAGKSTLAAYFHRRGHRVLCDDVCRVSIGEDGVATAWPGIPRIKLWRGALDALGIAGAGLEPVADDLDKFSLPTPLDADRTALPLASIYALNVATNGAGEIRRLSGIEAVTAILRNIYRPEYASLIGGSEGQFRQALDIAQSVNVFAASRRWGFDAFAEEVDALVCHIERP